MGIVLHPKQSMVVKDSHRFRVVCAGRRAGKTELAVNEMAGKAYAKGGRNIAYIAPTLQQARDIAWVQLVKVCAPITIKKLESPTHTLTVQTVDKGRSVISLRGWESIETMRGQAFDFLVIDEIASMRNWESSWNEILRPTLTDRLGECLFISTPKGFNHFYDLYNLANDKVRGVDYASFHFTSYDNPFLKKEELDKAKAELTEDQFAQEYLADFRKQEGLVYKEFSREKHVVEEIPDKVDDYIAGVDFGFTNPTAVVHIQRVDGVYYVTREWYHAGRTEDQVADYVRSCEFNYVYPDPEAPSAIEVMNRKGIPVVEVIKNKDSVKNGINRIRQLLKTNKLKIHKSCMNLISEFESYAYMNPKDGRNDNENPIKDHDHALDALRYALVTYNWEPSLGYDDYSNVKRINPAI